MPPAVEDEAPTATDVSLPLEDQIPKSEDAVEVDTSDVKEEPEEQDAVGPADEPASDEPAVAKSGEPVTSPQYKALRAVCDVLTDYKIIKKGDEYVPLHYAPMMSTKLQQGLLPIASFPAHTEQAQSSRLPRDHQKSSSH